MLQPRRSKLFLLSFFVIFFALTFSANATSLSLVPGSYGYTEDRKFDPPNLPFTADPMDVSIQSFIGWLLDEAKISPVGSIYGPGVSTWNNGVDFTGNTLVSSYGSAVGANASAIIYYDTQYVKYELNWYETYELSGNPGETADIWYKYFYDYSYFNMAVAGRSKSITALDYSYKIVPNGSNVATYSSSLPLYFSKQYNVVGGFEQDSGEQKGQFDIGVMGVGDRLCVSGTLKAYTECENYFAGLTVATIFPSFSVGLYATPINQLPEPSSPVPEPATMLLLGTGLIGLAGLRKKFGKH